MTSQKFILKSCAVALTLAGFTSCLQAQTATETAARPAREPQSSPSEKWESAIREFEKADLATPPPSSAVLFIGSSTIRFWKTLKQDFPDQPVINRGFGGSQMADSVYYADRIVLPYRPQQIIVYAGSNDLAAGKSPEEVASDFKAFVAHVRAKFPETRISFMSIGPSPARWSQADKQLKTNRLIKEYIATGKQLDYIDVWDQYLGADGKPRDEFFVADRLHNSEAGYKIRTEAVRPFLK